MSDTKPGYNGRSRITQEEEKHANSLMGEQWGVNDPCEQLREIAELSAQAPMHLYMQIDSLKKSVADLHRMMRQFKTMEVSLGAAAMTSLPVEESRLLTNTAHECLEQLQDMLLSA